MFNMQGTRAYRKKLSYEAEPGKRPSSIDMMVASIERPPAKPPDNNSSDSDTAILTVSDLGETSNGVVSYTETEIVEYNAGSEATDRALDRAYATYNRVWWHNQATDDEFSRDQTVVLQNTQPVQGVVRLQKPSADVGVSNIRESIVTDSDVSNPRVTS
jgi:hypothetical protein